MKSFYKVYKSENVTLGQKKSIEYVNQVVLQNKQLQEQDDGDNLDFNKHKVDEQLDIQKIINETKAQCELLINDAKEEAKSILAEAYEDSKNILEKAKEDGYRAGYEEGKEEGFSIYTELIEEAKYLKQGVYQFKKETAKELEKDLVLLVIESIKKIIQHELNENNELIFNVIKTAIDKCTFTERLVIRVSEYDYEVVSSSLNRIYMMTEGVDEIEIKCDKSLMLGSVIVETLSGRIDASIDTQIKQIENVFNELLKSE